jgi:DNA polymerase
MNRLTLTEALKASTAAAPPVHWDFETRSRLPLNKAGPWKYAADPTTEVLALGFAVGDGPVQVWRPGDPIPPEFIEAANNPDVLVCAHNAAFEIAIERLILEPRFGWPHIPLRQHRCTMAMALALALPARLETLAEALELIHQKDRAGHRLMLMMSKPRRPHKDEDPNGGPYWFDDPARMQRLISYMIGDVESEPRSL